MFLETKRIILVKKLQLKYKKIIVSNNMALI